MSEGLMFEGQMSEGQMSEGQMSERQMSERQMSKGQMSERQMSEGLMSELKLLYGIYCFTKKKKVFQNASMLLFFSFSLSFVKSSTLWLSMAKRRCFFGCLLKASFCIIWLLWHTRGDPNIKIYFMWWVGVSHKIMASMASINNIKCIFCWQKSIF